MGGTAQRPGHPAPPRRGPRRGPRRRYGPRRRPPAGLAAPGRRAGAHRLAVAHRDRAEPEPDPNRFADVESADTNLQPDVDARTDRAASAHVWESDGRLCLRRRGERAGHDARDDQRRAGRDASRVRPHRVRCRRSGLLA
ncbi:MAG: hypothetical protein EPN50_04625 [Chloroflexota bacterium]|nr:MAG: hypothetical protein EPN50_04625 [Chloroflexota bacterium]